MLDLHEETLESKLSNPADRMRKDLIESEEIRRREIKELKDRISGLCEEKKTLKRELEEVKEELKEANHIQKRERIAKKEAEIELRRLKDKIIEKYLGEL